MGIHEIFNNVQINHKNITLCTTMLLVFIFNSPSKEKEDRKIMRNDITNALQFILSVIRAFDDLFGDSYILKL